MWTSPCAMPSASSWTKRSGPRRRAGIREMEPYPIIRKLFATFGLDAMARDSLEKRLARMRDGMSSGGGTGAACSAVDRRPPAWAS